MSHCDLLLQVPSGRRSEEPTSPWDCSPISMLQLPAAMLSRGLASLPGVCMGIFPTQGSNSNRIVCVIVIPFRRSQISCFTLQQPQMLHLCPKQLPRCGDLTPASVPSPPPCADPFLPTLLFLPLLPLSSRDLHGSIYSFPIVRTAAHSQLVFCKIFCIWRCMPDISAERDVLHFYLLLYHLGSLDSSFLSKDEIS